MDFGFGRELLGHYARRSVLDTVFRPDDDALQKLKIAAGKEMNRLQSCMEALRRLAKEPDDPDCVILAEQAINEYLKNEVDALKAALTRVGEAIDEEAGKRQDEDWSVMIGYVQSCLEKLPSANEDWQQN